MGFCKWNVYNLWPKGYYSESIYLVFYIIH